MRATSLTLRHAATQSTDTMVRSIISTWCCSSMTTIPRSTSSSSQSRDQIADSFHFDQAIPSHPPHATHLIPSGSLQHCLVTLLHASAGAPNPMTQSDDKSTRAPYTSVSAPASPGTVFSPASSRTFSMRFRSFSIRDSDGGRPLNART